MLIDGEAVACSQFVVTMGPWAALAQDWFDMPIPMTGIKSTSIVFADEAKEVHMHMHMCMYMRMYTP